MLQSEGGERWGQLRRRAHGRVINAGFLCNPHRAARGFAVDRSPVGTQAWWWTTIASGWSTLSCPSGLWRASAIAPSGITLRLQLATCASDHMTRLARHGPLAEDGGHRCLCCTKQLKQLRVALQERDKLALPTTRAKTDKRR